MAKEATDVWRGYAIWSTARTCKPFYFTGNGKRPSQEPPSRFSNCFSNQTRTFGLQFDVTLNLYGFWMFLQSVKLGAIWLCWKGRVSFHLALICTGYGDGNFHCFSGPISDLFLSGFKGLFLHVRCVPQHNSQWQFWASVCLVTCACWIDGGGRECDCLQPRRDHAPEQDSVLTDKQNADAKWKAQIALCHGRFCPGGCGGPNLMRLEIGSPSSSLVWCWIRIYYPLVN